MQNDRLLWLAAAATASMGRRIEVGFWFLLEAVYSLSAMIAGGPANDGSFTKTGMTGNVAVADLSRIDQEQQSRQRSRQRTMMEKDSFRLEATR